MQSSSKNKYISELGTLSGAGITLIQTRTKEPYKVVEAVRDYVTGLNKKAKQNYNLGVWTAAAGWKVEDSDFLSELDNYDHDKGDPLNYPKEDEIKAPSQALKAILEESPQNDRYKEGFYVMIWPEFSFVDAGVRQYFLEIAVRFTEVFKRLIVVLPIGVGMFDQIQDYAHILDYGSPESEERKDIINYIIEGHKHNKTIKDASLLTTELEIKLISSAGAGMIQHEFENNLNRSIISLVRDKKEITTENIAKELLKAKAEIIKRSNALELLEFEKMENVGGLENLKAWISLRKNAFSDAARDFGVDTPKGILLAGCPGTGKSLAAKAIGLELGLPVIKFDLSSVFGGLVGQSESQMSQALNYIESIGSAIIVCDEIDKVFNMSSGGGDSGVSTRVLGKLLTFMQETKKQIFWVLTANRVDNLPPELLRKGRVDEIFGLSFPNEIEREQILKIHLKKRKQDPESLDLSRIIEASDKFVGAEIEGCVKDAILLAFSKKVPLTEDLILDQIKECKPISKSFETQIASLLEWATKNARPASKSISKKEAAKTTKLSSSPDVYFGGED